MSSLSIDIILLVVFWCYNWYLGAIHGSKHIGKTCNTTRFQIILNFNWNSGNQFIGLFGYGWLETMYSSPTLKRPPPLQRPLLHATSRIFSLYFTPQERPPLECGHLNLVAFGGGLIRGGPLYNISNSKDTLVSFSYAY